MLATMKRPSKSDRHKLPAWTLRLPPVYKQQVELASDKNRRNLSEEVKIALERYLRDEGLWPPAPKPGKSPPSAN